MVVTWVVSHGNHTIHFISFVLVAHSSSHKLNCYIHCHKRCCCNRISFVNLSHGLHIFTQVSCSPLALFPGAEEGEGGGGGERAGLGTRLVHSCILTASVVLEERLWYSVHYLEQFKNRFLYSNFWFLSLLAQVTCSLATLSTMNWRTADTSSVHEQSNYCVVVIRTTYCIGTNLV